MFNSINAKDLSFEELNTLIKRIRSFGENRISIKNVNGHSYIGAGLKGETRIFIEGTAGNDLAAFMDGCEIRIFGNVQDAVGNSMNSGKIIVEGSSGDTLGCSMKGGKIFLKGDAGCRAGVNMKEYRGKVPCIIIGGKTGDFLGEYMSGGILVVLGLKRQGNIIGDFCGRGMHGGVIYVRGRVKPYSLAREVEVHELSQKDMDSLNPLLEEYGKDFNLSLNSLDCRDFTKIVPKFSKPCGSVYSHH